MPTRSPVPQDVSEELRRVVQRWQQLPLDRALSRMPAVRLLLEALAEVPAPDARGLPVVPDLGPGVVMDQLTVLVYDACAAGRTQGLAHRLATLRHSLA